MEPEERIKKIKALLEDHNVRLSEDEFQDLAAEITLEANALTFAFIIETAALIWGFGFLESK